MVPKTPAPAVARLEIASLLVASPTVCVLEKILLRILTLPDPVTLAVISKQEDL